jgi:hypothetical protein
MRSRIALLLVAASTAFGAAAVAPATESLALTPVAAAKPCSSGWTHAVIGGEHKCLRAGQFCARRHDSQYRRYGYRCQRYDASVGRYRLTR